MVALDQMDGGGLDPRFVAGLLASPEPGLKDAASWIVGRHRDWALALAGVLGERLQADRSGARASGPSWSVSSAGLPRRPRSSGFWPAALRDASAPLGRTAEQPAGHGLVELEGRGRAGRMDQRAWPAYWTGRPRHAGPGRAGRRDPASIAHHRRNRPVTLPALLTQIAADRQDRRPTCGSRPSPPCPAGWSSPDEKLFTS